jgi:hypothetical protein
MLAIAGREADIVNLQGVSTAGGVVSEDPASRSPEAVAEKVERIRAAAGDRFERIELSTVVTVAVTDRPRQAAEEMARARGWGISAEQVLAMPAVLAGPIAHLVELLHERRRAFGLSYLILSDAALDTAAPLLERLASPAAR